MAMTARTVHQLHDWRNGAACRNSDPDLFFPVGSEGSPVDEILAAKTVCRSCPVEGQCLQYAFETNQPTGIWGGTTEEERRRLRRAWLADKRRRAEVRR